MMMMKMEHVSGQSGVSGLSVRWPVDEASLCDIALVSQLVTNRSTFNRSPVIHAPSASCVSHSQLTLVVKTAWTSDYNSHTCHWALGPELIPVYTARSRLFPLFPAGRLPLLFTRPVVTSFSAKERHRPSTGTKLYCLVTEAHRCEQLAQGWKLNPWPIDHLSNSLTLRHCTA